MIKFNGTIDKVNVKPVKAGGEVQGKVLQVTLTVDMNGEVLSALADAIGKDVHFRADTQPVLFDEKAS